MNPGWRSVGAAQRTANSKKAEPYGCALVRKVRWDGIVVPALCAVWIVFWVFVFGSVIWPGVG